MALATRCPHCSTVFRVANDQLKLRAGLVRCGACKEVFNGVEQLVPIEAPSTTSEHSAPPVADTPAIPAAIASPSASPVSDRPPLETIPDAPAGESIAASHDTSGGAITSDPQHGLDAGGAPPSAALDTDPRVSANASTDIVPAPGKRHDDPLQRMTLMDFAYRNGPAETSQSSTRDGAAVAQANFSGETDEDFLDSTIDELTRKPYRRVKPSAFGFRRQKSRTEENDPEFEEPGFVRRERQKKHAGKLRRLILGLGSGLLLVMLIAQAAHLYRNEIFAAMPSTKSALTSICGWIGCSVRLPGEIESVVIDSSELQLKPNSKTLFALSMSLHNKGTVAQAWPSIELTLNDTNEQAMVRRVFSPEEYVLPQSRIEDGIPARSEESFKLNFELLMPRAAGYKVYLFYP